jgi:hypothetical protein
MRRIGAWRYSSTHSLSSELDGGEWSASYTGHFIPEEISLGTHWIAGWVVPSAGLKAVVKRKISSPRRESNPNHPFIPILRMLGAIPPLTHTSSWRGIWSIGSTGTTLPFCVGSVNNGKKQRQLTVEQLGLKFCRLNVFGLKNCWQDSKFQLSHRDDVRRTCYFCSMTER